MNNSGVSIKRKRWETLPTVTVPPWVKAAIYQEAERRAVPISLVVRERLTESFGDGDLVHAEKS